MNTKGHLALVACFAFAITAVAMVRPRAGGPASDGAAPGAPQAPTGVVGATVAFRRAMVGRRAEMPLMVTDTEHTVEPGALPPERTRGRTVGTTTFRRQGAAEPRTLQVISVPVPVALGRGTVAFTATPSGRADLLSARSGRVTSAPSNEERATTLVARVPAGASAGPLEVAQIRFTNDSVTTTVAVELIVARVHRVVLRPTRAYMRAYSGERVAIDMIVQNLGNAPDTVQVAADLPSRWRGGRTEFVVLEPGAQRQVRLDLRAAPLPATGSVPLRLYASSHEGELTSLVVPVELLADRATVPQSRGPSLLAGIATAIGDSTGQSPVLGFALEGPLTASINVRGTLVHPTEPADFNSQAMGRVGYFRGSSYLNLSGNRWSVTGGRTGYGFSPIFGWNVYGLGASAEATSGRWTVAGVAVEERFNGISGGGHAGLNVSRTLGNGRLSAVVVRMDQQLSVARRLDAGGLSYTFSPRSGTLITGEAGYRSSSAGSGAAVSGEMRHRGARGQWNVYGAHAPGGSSAFARATDEVNANVWRLLTPKLVWRAAGFGSNNQSGNGNNAHARGVSTGSALTVGHASTIDLLVSAHSNAFDGLLGTIGSRELLGTLGGRSWLGSVSVNASVGVGSTTRTTELSGGGTFARSGGRIVARGGADAYTGRGSFAFDASVEQNSSYTGGPVTIGSVGVRATQVRLFASQRAPRIDAWAWINAYEGAPTNGPAVRIGTEFTLPANFSLAIDAERNPYTRIGGRTPWIAAIRFERSLALPGFRPASARGLVFDDVNGNGTRDGAEGGLAGVLVRRGEQTILTDADGSFRFYDNAPRTSLPSIDVASLAIGQLPATPRDARGIRGWAIPVVRTERLDAILVPTADSLGRTPVTRLDALSAIATDSTGAIWIARADSTGLAVFDALPAGRYMITPDLSASTERVRSLQAAQTVEVRPGQSRQVVRIPFGFRVVRVFDGGASGGGGRRR